MPPSQNGASASDWLRTLPLYLLPHHAISRLVGVITKARWAPFKDRLIRLFTWRYGVDLGEARYREPAAYRHFNAFFTRALRDGARPQPNDPDQVACPADGRLSQIGTVEQGRLFQSKGRWYGLSDLLGDADLAQELRGGLFATIYLAPPDYHRIHMPVAGRLRAMTHIPGRLFSVAPHTVRTVPGLFVRNERVVTAFDGANGPMALVLVGAVCVGSIETNWHGVVTPPSATRQQRWSYDTTRPYYGRGAEMARFNMGSTAILIMGAEQARWHEAYEPGQKVQVGEALGALTAPG
jgi:phosphatidylserine decarboxylase